jgi:hypothetical protein
MGARKYIRIALTPEDEAAFQAAKAAAEAATGVSMSDSQYALGLIRKATRG